MGKRFSSFVPLCLALLLCGCSINKWATRKAIDALASPGGSDLFSSDNDPELVAQSLPIIIKAHEGLLKQEPENPDLLLATGSLICMYAYAFVQLPAEMLGNDRFTERKTAKQRAKKLLIRSRDYLFRALDTKYPEFTAGLREGKTEYQLARTCLADSSLLYWTGSAWLASISIDKNDMKNLLDMPKAVAFLQHLEKLAPAYDKGAVQQLLITYYGSLPSGMGGSEQRAREYFKKAVELSGGNQAAPYLSLAESVVIGKQDREEFTRLLQTALAVNVDEDPSYRLVNVLYQRKAQWMLDNIDDFILSESGDEWE